MKKSVVKINEGQLKKIVTESVKKVLKENIFPLLLPTGQEESDYYDDNYKAHMRAMLYRNVCRDNLL